MPVTRTRRVLGCFSGWLLLLSFTFGVVPCYGQQQDAPVYTLVLRGVSLQQALEELVATTSIDLMYDTPLLRETSVYCSARDQTAETILRCILDEAGLDFYRLSSGTYVLIEPAAKTPRYGRLAGVVIDRDTGEPLPYANVFLADASIGTATNDAGMFSFKNLLPGPSTIVASYVGYEPHVDRVWIAPDGTVRHEIALRSRALVVAPVVVNGLQQRLPSQALGTGARHPTLSAGGEIGGTTDVIRSVQSLLGVNLRSPLAHLHIQGGEAGEHQMMLDGAPVFSPVSLGQMLGAFSPLAIERLTVHKAGFGASHGSQLAGLVTAEHDLVNQTHRLVVQVDPLSLNTRFDTPLPPVNGVVSSIMAAARKSLWDQYRYPTFDTLLRDWNTADPVLTSTLRGVPTRSLAFTPHRHSADLGFSDLHAALQVKFNPFHKLYASAYRGRNDVATELLTSSAEPMPGASPLIMLSRDHYAWTNLVGQARYEWLLGARAFGTLQLRGSRHTLEHGYELIDNETADLSDDLTVPQIEDALLAALDATDTGDANHFSEVAMESTLDYSLGTRHQFHLGLEAVRVANRFRVDSLFFQPLVTSFSGWRVTTVAEDRITLGRRSTLDVGARLTYIPDRQTVYAEPRLAFRYDGAYEVIGDYAFRLAGGVYRQFVNQFDLSSVGPSAAVSSVRFWLPVDNTLAPPRAYHLAADVLIHPDAAWTINLEGYYKWQPSLLAIDYTSLIHDTDRPHQADQVHFIARTRGFSYGSGLRVEHRDQRMLTAMTYSYSVSRRRFPSRFDNRMQTVPWNEPHRFTFSSDVFLTDAVTARVRTHGVWGRRWGFRQAYYDFLAAHSLPDAFAPFVLDRPSEDQLTALVQVDLGLSYQRSLGNVRVELHADVLNLLNRANVVDWHLLPSDNTYQKADRLLPGRTPAFSIQVGY